ncbi:MAG: hypothetical protein BWY66_02131 [bacterium ADurb.Bin374]|nr:MAG: hypothetical protein BWY66_02131 [bacterium ADurb.Bin374]
MPPLAARGFESRREGDRGTDDGEILPAGRGADLARDHLAVMDADAVLDGKLAAQEPVPVERGKRPTHRQPGARGADDGVCGSPILPENGLDGVTDELVDLAAKAADDAVHRREVFVQHRRDLRRRLFLGYAREVPDVGTQYSCIYITTFCRLFGLLGFSHRPGRFREEPAHAFPLSQAVGHLEEGATEHRQFVPPADGKADVESAFSDGLRSLLKQADRFEKAPGKIHADPDRQRQRDQHPGAGKREHPRRLLFQIPHGHPSGENAEMEIARAARLDEILPVGKGDPVRDRRPRLLRANGKPEEFAGNEWKLRIDDAFVDAEDVPVTILPAFRGRDPIEILARVDAEGRSADKHAGDLLVSQRIRQAEQQGRLVRKDHIRDVARLVEQLPQRHGVAEQFVNRQEELLFRGYAARRRGVSGRDAHFLKHPPNRLLDDWQHDQAPALGRPEGNLLGLSLRRCVRFDDDDFRAARELSCNGQKVAFRLPRHMANEGCEYLLISFERITETAVKSGHDPLRLDLPFDPADGFEIEKAHDSLHHRKAYRHHSGKQEDHRRPGAERARHPYSAPGLRRSGGLHGAGTGQKTGQKPGASRGENEKGDDGETEPHPSARQERFGAEQHQLPRGMRRQVPQHGKPARHGHDPVRLVQERLKLELGHAAGPHEQAAP